MSPAKPLPRPISHARAVPYEDTFLILGGRHSYPRAEPVDENDEIYKFVYDERVIGAEKGEWIKLPQKTRKPNYTGM